jgi:hypothetical protein
VAATFHLAWIYFLQEGWHESDSAKDLVKEINQTILAANPQQIDAPAYVIYSQ